MTTADKLSVLKSISRKFNAEGITWALGASMLLYFKGIAPDFNDIDIMIADGESERVMELMALLRAELRPFAPNEKYGTKTFLEYVVSGVEVDIIEGFAIMSGGRLHSCPLRPDQIAEYADLDGERIPLQSVELWRGYYELMGRAEKVRMIESFGRGE